MRRRRGAAAIAAVVGPRHSNACGKRSGCEPRALCHALSDAPCSIDLSCSFIPLTAPGALGAASFAPLSAAVRAVGVASPDPRRQLIEVRTVGTHPYRAGEQLEDAAAKLFDVVAHVRPQPLCGTPRCAHLPVPVVSAALMGFPPIRQSKFEVRYPPLISQYRSDQ
jgi:hypothetical protein